MEVKADSLSPMDGRFITASTAEKLTYFGPFVVVEAGCSLSRLRSSSVRTPKWDVLTSEWVLDASNNGVDTF
jgi:hypothetical protein